MVLREVVVMNARAEMYLKFIEKRIMVRYDILSICSPLIQNFTPSVILSYWQRYLVLSKVVSGPLIFEHAQNMYLTMFKWWVYNHCRVFLDCLFYLSFHLLPLPPVMQCDVCMDDFAEFSWLLAAGAFYCRGVEMHSHS